VEKMSLSRLANEVINTPLMILPDKLDVILGVIGDRIGVDSVEIQSLGYDMDAGKKQLKDVPKNISVIPVFGSLVNRTHGLDAMSGLTTYDSIRNDFRAALDSDSDAILLDIDSPGGSASGVLDLSDEIYAARGGKPIYAVANENAFSAAYAIASAADTIFLSRTGHVGSIGVIAVHRDQSAANEKEGVKYTSIYKGDRKTDLSPHQPLSDEGKAMLEDEVSDHYDLFVKTVARNRGIPEAQVKATQAGMFMGEKAVLKDLADEVLAFSDVPSRILTDLNVNLEREEDIAMTTKKEEAKLKEKEVKIMNAQELRDKYPDMVSEIEDAVSMKLSAEFTEKETVMQAENGSLKESVLKLQKSEAIRQVREVKADADSIWTQALSGSDVPERLHDKVKVQVSHDKFVQDGLLDRTGFADAVKAEVEDWETKGATSQVMGTGFSSKDVEDEGATKLKREEKTDEALADSLFEASGGSREGVK
jgi:capsid assembly protease